MKVKWQRGECHVIANLPQCDQVKFLANGQLFYRNYHEESINCLDCLSRKETKIMQSHGSIADFSVAREGTFLAAHISRENVLHVFDIKQGRIINSLKVSYKFCLGKISPTGRFVFGWTIDPFKACLWEVKNHKLYLKWRIPEHLEVEGTSLKNTEEGNGDANLRLISQIQETTK